MTRKTLICNKTINIKYLIAAFDNLKKGHHEAQNQLEKDGVFKRFELTYELTWKTLKKVIQYKGIEIAGGPRDIFRAAYVAGIIDSADFWFTVIKNRNLAVHTYDENFSISMHNELPQIITTISCIIAELQRL